MNQEIILPTDQDHWRQLRSQDITSTEMAALFGLSPYATEFELYHRHLANEIVTIEENERMKWGTRLQDAIALGVGQDQNWHVRPMKEYIRLKDIRIGASFDWRIQVGTEFSGEQSKVPRDCDDDGLLEIKNVDALIFRDGWLIDEDGNVEAPPHIEIQVQQQMMVSGLKWCRIAALVGGNKVILIERKLDEDVVFSIIEKATKFWERIETKTPPSPDFERDAEFIVKLYQHAEPGRVADVSQSPEFCGMALEHKRLGDEIKTMTDQRDALKAQMMMAIGDAEKAVGDGFTVTAGTVGPAEVAYHRDGYRMFRINWPRKKKGT